MPRPNESEPIGVPKDLVAASAAPLVLGILARGESYGYAILAQVRDLSGGRLEWKEGMLYPVLHRLERNGWVTASERESKDGRKRRYYRITPSGRRCLAEHRAQWMLMTDVLNLAWERSHV
jgi:PadR family transcriptional regulator, regulatory protein PadR